jgi:hypothetical protein
MLNKLWSLTWYAYIGASLVDPRFSIQYIGRYTKRAVMAEYRIVYYDGKIDPKNLDPNTEVMRF